MTYLSIFFTFKFLYFGSNFRHLNVFIFTPRPPPATNSFVPVIPKIKRGVQNIWGRIESFRLHRSPIRVYLSFGVSWTLNSYVIIIVIPTCLERVCIYGSQLIFPLSFLRRFWMKSIRQDSVPWSTLTISQIPSLTRTSLL